MCDFFVPFTYFNQAVSATGRTLTWSGPARQKKGERPSEEPSENNEQRVIHVNIATNAGAETHEWENWLYTYLLNDTNWIQRTHISGVAGMGRAYWFPGDNYLNDRSHCV